MRATSSIPRLQLSLLNPAPQGKAVAVQQHQDIIAVNALAKAAGVVKHAPPAEARRLLAPLGGRVVHVFTADGGRVSYQPYRCGGTKSNIARGVHGPRLLSRHLDLAAVNRKS